MNRKPRSDSNSRAELSLGFGGLGLRWPFAGGLGFQDLHAAGDFLAVLLLVVDGDLASLARVPRTLVSALRTKVHSLFFFPTALRITKLVSLDDTTWPVAWCCLGFSVALAVGEAALFVAFAGGVACAAQQVLAKNRNRAVNRTRVFLFIGFALLWLARRIMPLNSGGVKRSQAYCAMRPIALATCRPERYKSW